MVKRWLARWASRNISHVILWDDRIDVNIAKQAWAFDVRIVDFRQEYWGLGKWKIDMASEIEWEED